MTNDIMKNYRAIVAQETNPLAVLALACERVAKDIFDAIRAIEAHDIPTKTGHLNHALTLIAYIENMLNKNEGGEDAMRLQCFYNMSRVHILLGSAHLSGPILGQIAGYFMEMSQAWRNLQAKLDNPPETSTLPVAAQDSYTVPALTEPRFPAAWSA